jgi:hypothetical protein
MTPPIANPLLNDRARSYTAISSVAAGPQGRIFAVLERTRASSFCSFHGSVNVEPQMCADERQYQSAPKIKKLATAEDDGPR